MHTPRIYQAPRTPSKSQGSFDSSHWDIRRRGLLYRCSKHGVKTGLKGLQVRELYQLRRTYFYSGGRTNESNACHRDAELQISRFQDEDGGLKSRSVVTE